jgi:glycolate oxidase FAD binding subunit
MAAEPSATETGAQPGPPTDAHTGADSDADADRGPEEGLDAGVPPAAPRVRPAGLTEAVDALRTAAEEERALLFAGAGTALEWGGPLSRSPLVFETGGLDRLVSHAPGDWTATAQAGMPLTTLQQHLAPAGQWLPLDPPTGDEGATLGGLLAGGDTGPRRLAFGGLADLVIGATLVTADGSALRTGGDVIKNVAGYDLAKLFAGSLGAFGLIAQLTLRVHPLPRASATLSVPLADAAAALEAARAAMRSPLEPVAAEWDGRRLLVRFHGTKASAAAKADRGARLPALHGAHLLGAEEEEAAWRQHAALVRGEEGETVLRAGTHPARLPALDARLRQLARRHGLQATLLSAPATGTHTAVLRGGGTEGHAACVSGWRAAVCEEGGTALLRRRRDGVAQAAGAWGDPPPTVPVLRALKRQLDPGERCAPGRFAPWF